VKRRDAEDLWRRFGAGDGSAFAQLYRDHQGDVFRYCRSLLHDEEDAHDAAQCTWTAIWTAPGAARREIPLRPWLFRVAHNESISILRRRRRHDELTDLEVPALDDVASDVELRDRLATLRADLVSLPERQRAALLLREVGGLGHTEIAELFGISAAAAKQTIYEARRALHEAEGGRSMACDLVQRAISDGDGRVRRGRRLRAHLRGSAACRTFDDAVGRRRRDLGLLFPAPAGIGVVAQATVGSGAGGAAGGSLVAAGGSVGAKLAVAVVIAAAGVGGQHEIAHAGGSRAKGGRASPEAAPLQAPRAAPGGATTTAEPSRAAQRRVPTRASAGGTAAGSTSADTESAGDPPAPSAEPAAVPPTAGQAAASHGHSPEAPGHMTTSDAAEPRGQAKKTGVAEPPGQAKKSEATQPPGQVRKSEAAEPPGQAKKGEVAEPPGQARKSEAAQPPGQAKKTAAGADADTSAAASPAPPAATSAPATNGNGNATPSGPPGQDKADTPPGHVKK
jgi:RNA polymerase sigma factor (sigma-70 family)